MSTMLTSPVVASTPNQDVADFRRFNRMYTRYTGTLNEKLVESDFSLPEARVLYELASLDTPKAVDITERLGMDPAYLSRMLGKFERDGLLRKKTSPQDGRSTELVLTSAGKSAFSKLNRLSNGQAESILDALETAARKRLLASMQQIEVILTKVDREPPCYILRPHRIGDMGWVVHRESIGYAEQYGWDQRFEAFLAKIVEEFIANYDPERERCWIAEVDGQNLGHVFLMKHPHELGVAKLRLLFVERQARGTGVGAALATECVRFARTAGYKKIVLWTQSILTPALRIYRKLGFRLVKEEPHQSFGQDLVGQEWELDLNGKQVGGSGVGLPTQHGA